MSVTATRLGGNLSAVEWTDLVTMSHAEVHHVQHTIAITPSSSYHHRSGAIKGPQLVEGQGDQAEDVQLALNEDIVHIKKR